MSRSDTGEMRRIRKSDPEDHRGEAPDRVFLENRDPDRPQHLGRSHETTPGPVDRPRNAGRPWTIGAWACAVIALFIWPIVFGLAGIALGVVGYRKGDPLGRTAAIVSGIALVLSFVVGAWIMAGT